MKIGLVSDALKIALQKVSVSIYNIIVFRNIYSLVLSWLDGFFAFVVTVYIVGKVKTFAQNFYTDVRRKVFLINKQKNLKQNGIDFEFDPKKLTCQQIDETNEQTLLACKSPETDLFNFIFGAASQSSLLNLVVIISIEYFNTKFKLGLALSIFYVVGLAFLLCFISSFRYMSLVAKKSSTNECGSRTNSRKYLIMYDGLDFVCFIRTTVDLNLPELSVELENFSAKYSNKIGEIVEFYAKNYCNEAGTLVQDEEHDRMVVVDRFKFTFPDYYDPNYELTNMLRKLGYKKERSWVEFRVLPLCNLNSNVFTNSQSLNKKS
jgi:hypothetical protein